MARTSRRHGADASACCCLPLRRPLQCCSISWSWLLDRDEDRPVRERCTATVSGASWSLNPDQAVNASTITAVAVARGLPPRAASIALATAVQESGLRNLDYGDNAGPDSRGLFQQRPSQGWGSQEQVMDPVYAANAFYDALVEVPGYQDLPITVAAQTVQRSAFPDAYADHESEGRAFASALTGQTPAALTLHPESCRGSRGSERRPGGHVRTVRAAAGHGAR